MNSSSKLVGKDQLNCSCIDNGMIEMKVIDNFILSKITHFIYQSYQRFEFVLKFGVINAYYLTFIIH